MRLHDEYFREPVPDDVRDLLLPLGFDPGWPVFKSVPEFDNYPNASDITTALFEPYAPKRQSLHFWAWLGRGPAEAAFMFVDEFKLVHRQEAVPSWLLHGRLSDEEQEAELPTCDIPMRAFFDMTVPPKGLEGLVYLQVVPFPSSYGSHAPLRWGRRLPL